MSDTPETDAVAEKINFGVDIDFARKLERERDEAREAFVIATDQMVVAQGKVREANKERDEALIDRTNGDIATMTINHYERILRERDEVRGLLASEKITRDHIIKRGVEVQKERDEAWDNLKITQQEWARARRERAEALRERDEAREALRALAPLTYHDCHFSKDMMGNCILCKREETK
jgi:hypothetical protein